MTCHVVLGDGVAGRHHQRVIRSAGRTVLAVADNGQANFAEAWRRLLRVAPPETIWHICTPTNSHLAYLGQILAARPGAPIILEKPIGRPGEKRLFRRLVAKAPVVVQSQYSYARVVEPLRDILASWRQDRPLTIKIDFGKQRPLDGRFIDADRGVFGYEVFHQLALGVRILRADGARLRVVDARLGPRAGHVRLAAGKHRLELSSDLDSSHRYARICVLSDGQQAELAFEATHWFTGTPRQTHLLSTRGAETVFEEDLMYTGILAGVDALERLDWGRIRENQSLATSIETLLDAAVVRG